MSDMSSATFTARDLSRKTAAVLKEAARLGSVRIRTRNGASFSISADRKWNPDGGIPDFAARRRAAGMKQMAAGQERMLDDLIGGE